MKIIDYDKVLLPIGQSFTRIKAECRKRPRRTIGMNTRGKIVRNGYYPISMFIREKLEELCNA